MAMRYPGGLIATSPVNAAYPSGVWTQSQTIPYTSQNVWQNDQYWRNTTLLLHGDGTNGAQNNTFLDSSSNNFSITRNGNTTQGAFTPYQQNGYWSNYFDGSSSVLSFSNNTAFAFGTGSFTIEFWINAPLNNDKFILEGRNAIGTMHITTGGFSSTAGVLRYVGSSTIVSSNVITDNTWHHCAIVRNGSSAVTLYVDGVSVGTGTDSTNYTTTSGTFDGIAGRSGVGNYLTGYLSNFRIVKGTAVYTSAFTPSTAPLTAISGTSLLTCQSNRFVDNSSNAFAITVSGSPSVQAFQPFPGPTTWSASVLGGSGYFDGSGDFLNFTGTNFNVGTGAFTLEGWIYMSSYQYSGIVSSWNSAATGVGFFLGVTNTGIPQFSVGDANTGNNDTILGPSALPLNTWVYLAATKSAGSGGTMTLYVNGVSVATTTTARSVDRTATVIGRYYQDVNNYYLTGYMADVRVSNTVRTITVPTAPFSSDANTSLLLNFTNGGIIDNAQKNDLETVGNAQVSTSVVKYGTGSMAFDGSGDYLVGRTTDLLSFNTGDFTVEMWVYPNSVAGNIVLIDTRSSGTDSGWAFYINSSSKLALFTSNADRITAGSALSASTWTHVVLARSGSTLAIYMNGVQSATATYSTTMTCPGRISVASGFDNAAPLNGYIDDLRITKGVARYTANFTPPIARMPNQ